MTQPLYPTTTLSEVVDLQNAVLQLQTHAIQNYSDQNAADIVSQSGLNIGGLHVASGITSGVSATLTAPNYFVTASQTNLFEIVSPIGVVKETGFWAFAYNNSFVETLTPVIIDSKNAVILPVLKDSLFLYQFIFQYFTLTATQDTGAVQIILNGTPWWLGTFSGVWQGSSATTITGLSTTIDILNAGFTS